MRLAPLIQVEAALLRKLVPPEQADILARADPNTYPFYEISVNSNMGWKNTLNRLLGSSSERSSFDSLDLVNWSDPEDPGVILHACSEDMIKLWADPTVKELLDIEKMRPE